MMNKVFLVGRITRDPELRQNSNNTPYCFFTVAINRLPGPNGERQADFISCVAWGKQAENLARFIRQGGLIGVDGTLQTRTVNDNQQQRTIMEVHATNITFLESRGAIDNRANVNQQMPYQQNQYNQAGANQYSRQNNQGYNQYQQANQNAYGQFNQRANNASMNQAMPQNSYNPFNQTMPNEPTKSFSQEGEDPFAIPADDIPF